MSIRITNDLKTCNNNGLRLKSVYIYLFMILPFFSMLSLIFMNMQIRSFEYVQFDKSLVS